ncbi:hypothetical protein PIB30_066372 [Stylosanthes scabra]|uniref:Uncharacterized protein n=1 Tax=Stylosanthes scabra TaxID=79078 RepID=A0ABU6SN69_9FABA|nr:hypothetical protein [Stylosanthes scabra]
MEEEIEEPEVMEPDEDEYNGYFADYFRLAPPPSQTIALDHLLLQMTRCFATPNFHRGPSNFQVWGGSIAYGQHKDKNGYSGSNAVSIDTHEVHLGLIKAFKFSSPYQIILSTSHLSPVTTLERPFDDYTGFNRQSSERKWLKRARGTRRSQTKPRRPFLDPVRTHPRASAYAPIALGSTPRVEIGANAYSPEAPMRMHQCSPPSINRGSLHHSKESAKHISLV